jgi:hypothetical protein
MSASRKETATLELLANIRLQNLLVPLKLLVKIQVDEFAITGLARSNRGDSGVVWPGPAHVPRGVRPRLCENSNRRSLRLFCC